MSWTLPALQCKMGRTKYYITSMKANELVSSVTIPKDMEGWDNLSIDEIYQRDVQYARVKNQIVPYLTQNEDRFFGSLIVAAHNFDAIKFEPLTQASGTFPASVSEAATAIGFLTIPGGSPLVPLDGQHRLAALKFAISGKDEVGKDIPNIKYNSGLAEEDVCIIIVSYDTTRARAIFTNVNRYARTPSGGQVIITDDDDPYAIIARAVANNVIGGRLVQFKGANNLGISAPHFTTLAIVYNCCIAIISGSFPVDQVSHAKRQTSVDHDKIKMWTTEAEKVWGKLCADIDIFADALTNTEESGDSLRIEIRKNNLLGKPVAQECLVRAYMRLKSLGITHKMICEKLNLIPWKITEDNIDRVWLNVLWSGGSKKGKIITKEANRKIASRLISYMLGENLDSELLLSDIQNLFPESQRLERKLPDRVG